MNPMTYWVWVMRGFGGLSDMVNALVSEGIPATNYVYEQLVAIHEILGSAIQRMKVEDK